MVRARFVAMLRVAKLDASVIQDITEITGMAIVVPTPVSITVVGVITAVGVTTTVVYSIGVERNVKNISGAICTSIFYFKPLVYQALVRELF